ncbi:MAG TPA: TetR family transcriptional regulator [Burkholderiaceae bacterium]|nr:TetR family transcriptional regulator [Burkholderiaceae bacterium]
MKTDSPNVNHNDSDADHNHRPATGVGRPRKNKTEGNPETASRILDAAEELFAMHGFYGVTVRAVAAHASVDAALAHYYFRTKQGLFDAVFLRRAEVINRERMEAMQHYQQQHGDAMTVEGLVTAFLTPLLNLERHRDRGWRNYFALAAQMNNTRDFGTDTMTRYFDPVVLHFIEALHRILPAAHKEDLFWSYHMLTGSLTLTLSDTGRLDRLSGGLCYSADIAAATPRLIAYSTAGIKAVCLGRR